MEQNPAVQNALLIEQQQAQALKGSLFAGYFEFK